MEQAAVLDRELRVGALGDAVRAVGRLVDHLREQGADHVRPGCSRMLPEPSSAASVALPEERSRPSIHEPGVGHDDGGAGEQLEPRPVLLEDDVEDRVRADDLADLVERQPGPSLRAWASRFP